MRRSQGQAVTTFQIIETIVFCIILSLIGFLCLKFSPSTIMFYGIIAGGIVLCILVKLIIFQKINHRLQWYESLLDAIPFPISVTDMNMNWTFINKAVENMLGIKRQQVLGKPCKNWGAAICDTQNCGISCLKKGKNKTTFEQAGMDFQVDVSYLLNRQNQQIGHIEIVQDISHIVKAQNSQAKLVYEINDLCVSFVSASDGIANGSQELAQGSIEQAATVQRLSSSIADVTQQIELNTQQAEQAAALATSIQADAEQGNTQMAQMMQSMQEISEASQSIEKVMKVINDIAFQTNILALNAAVEAARAGQHGKGFAVVADEVRNLASKSAEAAKDTGILIANSIEKSSLGAQISLDTAASLEKIIEGIKQSEQVISQISISSQAQNKAIREINSDIEEVSSVVQKNSATAQQSAAASQELNSQTNLLRNMLNNFDVEINASKSA